MKIKIVFFLIVIILMVNGCLSINNFFPVDSFFVDQYVIDISTYKNKDKIYREVKKIATELANNLNFIDKTDTTLVKKTIFYFVENVENFQVTVGARIKENYIIFDISLFIPGTEVSNTYRKVLEKIEYYGNKYYINDFYKLEGKDHIPIKDEDIIQLSPS